MELSELRLLYELFETKDRVKAALASIREGYVSMEHFDSGDYFPYDGMYYADDEFVISGDDYLLRREEGSYCEETHEYWHDDDIRRCYIGRGEYFHHEGWAADNLNYYNGDYYDNEALDNHDIVYCEDSGEYEERHNAYYNENDGCYYSESQESYTRGYHDGSYKTVYFGSKTKYKIGYEIEKEDEDVLESIHIDNFESQTDHVWRKEKDGSLDSSSGYELISPAFELNIGKIFEHIEGNELLVKHINADISSRCGGHIHLSHNELTGHELFDKIKGYTPLLYALYYGRVDKTYCKGKNNRDLQNENEKYQAIKIHGNRIEFRIISAVPSVKTLKWRTKLLMMILRNPTDDVIRAYYNVDTKFTNLLKQTYSDDRLIELKQRFIKFTKQFEGIDIK
jgi:hypothetical protein